MIFVDEYLVVRGVVIVYVWRFGWERFGGVVWDDDGFYVHGGCTWFEYIGVCVDQFGRVQLWLDVLCRADVGGCCGVGTQG